MGLFFSIFAYLTPLAQTLSPDDDVRGNVTHRLIHAWNEQKLIPTKSGLPSPVYFKQVASEANPIHTYLHHAAHIKVPLLEELKTDLKADLSQQLLSQGRKVLAEKAIDRVSAYFSRGSLYSCKAECRFASFG